MDPTIAYMVVIFIVLALLYAMFICAYQPPTKRWILRSVDVLPNTSQLSFTLFQVRVEDTSRGIICSVKKEWQQFRGSYFPTYGYTGGLFTQLDDMFPGEFNFPQARYSSFTNYQEKSNALYSALKSIEIHPIASRTNIVIGFLGIN